MTTKCLKSFNEQLDIKADDKKNLKHAAVFLVSRTIEVETLVLG